MDVVLIGCGSLLTEGIVVVETDVDGLIVDRVVLNFVVGADVVEPMVDRLEVDCIVVGLDVVLRVVFVSVVASVGVAVLVVRRVLVAEGVVVEAFDLGSRESTTPIGPSRSISDSGQVSSSD